MIKLPYFDYLLALLEAGDEMITASFGRHVHWGYWNEPKQADLTSDDFARATENLSAQVCIAGHIDKGLSVLDVGCGFGGTIAYLNDNFNGMKLTGLNLDERQLNRARAIVTPVEGNRIDFLQGDACALPFPDQTFDVVLAVECIFHFPDRGQFFKEAHRVLKPGGYLALSDFLSTALIRPFTQFPLPEWLSNRFYGACNLEYSIQHYHTLSQETGFTLNAERDITLNTLPTYRYLKKFVHLRNIVPKRALMETSVIEILSRLRLINYFILAFKKAD
ncbi:MAG: class I SAM-dependent methyltransferase [Methylococcaceae bacterium]|nr:class I SAM-dependent methyltransferase [Methylococcaceae bacterium]